MLSKEELQIYDRQIMIPEIGEKGQEKLKKSRVFIAGAGGLGSPVSLYLAAAGVGTIVIDDNDSVDMSNLNRQILHGYRDIGIKKVDSAKNRLVCCNKNIKVVTIDDTLTDENIIDYTEGCDAIVDAMDNFAARHALNKAAIKWGIPLFHGAVNGTEGRATTIIPGKTACIACMYQDTVETFGFPVLGVAPGVIGVIQATEVIKYIVGMGDLLENRLLIYDGMDLSFKEFKLKKNPECNECSEL